MNWPTAGLPSGFPKYPGGVVVSIDKEDQSIYVYVTGTDRKTYDAYVKTLEAASWAFEDPVGEEDVAKKDNLIFVMVFGGDGVGISVSDGIGFVDDGNNKWPQDLPVELPVYPDGTIESSWAASNGNIYI